MTESTALSRPGKFISFEGIDGAGKSSHIASVVAWLQAQGEQVVSTREPGGTQLGEQLRQLLLHTAMHVETEALLMFAARREHLAQVIEPALQQGKWVVTDRFTDATFAYQGGGRKVPLAKLDALEQWVHPQRQPDLTLLFDVPLVVASARLAKARTPDKFEQEQADFFNATRNEYLRRAKQHAARFRIIDASHSLPEVAQAVADTLQAFYRSAQA